MQCILSPGKTADGYEVQLQVRDREQDGSLSLHSFFFTWVTKNLVIFHHQVPMPHMNIYWKVNSTVLAPPLMERCFWLPLKGFWQHNIKVVCQWDVDWIVNDHWQHIRRMGRQTFVPGNGLVLALVHWTPSHWAQVWCPGRKFVSSFFLLYLSARLAWPTFQIQGVSFFMHLIFC